MRQQLLAWRMEQAKELGADVVRVLLVAPRGNEAFWSSLPGEPWHTLAASSPLGVAEAFRSVLRRPDRFAWLDSATLVGEDSPLSKEFKARYSHLGAGAELAMEPPPSGGAVTLHLTAQSPSSPASAVKGPCCANFGTTTNRPWTACAPRLERRCSRRRPS